MFAPVRASARRAGRARSTVRETVAELWLALVPLAVATRRMGSISLRSGYEQIDASWNLGRGLSAARRDRHSRLLSAITAGSAIRSRGAAQAPLANRGQEQTRAIGQ